MTPSTTPSTPTILVVDDKELIRDGVCETLRRAGFEIESAADAHAALAQIANKRPDVVVSDLRMPGMTGVELLSAIRKIDEELPVLLMTAFGTIETAVAAMRLGAFDYLTKPFEGDELVIAVKRAIEHRRLLRENQVLRAEARDTRPLGTATTLAGMHRLIGSSQVMQNLRGELAAVAGSQGTVLITGESGAGKEVIARAIHESSPRAGGPFLAMNCAALSESILESELFGHERGAFTGADKLRKGRFELADGGTLLLDEISEISPKIQAKLLRVLQERNFERVGSSQAIGVDVRVIATSNRNLPASVAKGEFRQDLYYRLNVLPVSAPPLRARVEDVAELAAHFVDQVCRREGRGSIDLTPGALELMRIYDWPGNVRELQNVCERAVVLSSAGGQSRPITRELIEPWLIGMPNVGPSDGVVGHIIPELKLSGTPAVARTLEDIERDTIVNTLQKFNGHRAKTASALGIGVRTLGLKLKRWKELKIVNEAL